MTAAIDWKRHVAQHEKSGLRVEDYCKREGISTWTFYEKRRALLREGQLPDVKAILPHGSTPGQSPFVSVGTIGHKSPELSLIISFANGTTAQIKVPQGGNHLFDIIHALQGDKAGGTSVC